MPLAALIIFTLRRTGFGRLLYAVGDNEKATRLSGVLYWQVILALYVVSGLLAGIAGLLYVGLIKAPSLSLAEPLLLPSVAAAVIGGTSIFGGRGGYAGTIVGALILTVLTTLLTMLQMPEGARRILFGADRPARHRRLSPHHRGSLTPKSEAATSVTREFQRRQTAAPLRSRRRAGSFRGPAAADRRCGCGDC